MVKARDCLSRFQEFDSPHGRRGMVYGVGRPMAGRVTVAHTTRVQIPPYSPILKLEEN